MEDDEPPERLLFFDFLLFFPPRSDWRADSLRRLRFEFGFRTDSKFASRESPEVLTPPIESWAPVRDGADVSELNPIPLPAALPLLDRFDSREGIPTRFAIKFANLYSYLRN